MLDDIQPTSNEEDLSQEEVQAVAEWAKANGLSTKTLDKLIKNGFTSMDLMSTIRPNNVKALQGKEMSLAQSWALARAINRLAGIADEPNPSARKEVTPQPTTPTSQASTIDPIGGAAGQPTNPTSQASTTDPAGGAATLMTTTSSSGTGASTSSNTTTTASTALGQSSFALASILASLATPSAGVDGRSRDIPQTPANTQAQGTPAQPVLPPSHDNTWQQLWGQLPQGQSQTTAQVPASHLTNLLTAQPSEWATQMAAPVTQPGRFGPIGPAPIHPLSFPPPVPIKPLLISEFLPRTMSSISTEDQVLPIGEGGSHIIFKMGGNRTKLSDISPAAWTYANSRIQDRLCAEGRLDVQGNRDYLMYTSKVGELAMRYTWNSVVAYDNEYRVQQAEHGFRWGADIQHLAYTLLVAKPVTQPQRKSHPTQQRRQASPQEVCRNYNNNRCTRSNCRFRHVCSKQGCNQGHPATEHDKPKTQ